MVQFSHPYMTPGKMITLTIQTFVSKIFFVRKVFNALSRFIITYSFFPKEQVTFNLMAASPSTVILEPKKIKSVTVSIFSSSICHEVMVPDGMILGF